MFPRVMHLRAYITSSELGLFCGPIPMLGLYATMRTHGTCCTVSPDSKHHNIAQPPEIISGIS